MYKDFIEDRINVFLEEFGKLVVKENIPVTDFLYKECDYKLDNTLPEIDDSFTLFTPYINRWGGKKDKHAWFYNEIKVPENWDGEIQLAVASDARLGWCDINPQFIAYVDGKLQQGIDKNHREVFLTKGNHKVYLYAYSGSVHDEYVDFVTNLQLIDAKTKQLYYDIRVPFEILAYEDENSRNYFEIKKYLNTALNFIDMRSPYSEEYYASLDKAIDYLKTEFYGKYCRKGDVFAFCIGHTHIDVAWEWTLAQTREKILRSFSTVLALMKKYPEYKFMSSQPQLYKYLKMDAPELYEEVKEMVRLGRWDVEGGMWVEADCNLCSGESLVRQFVYGKRFMKDEFGVDSKILWLPDVFGYSAALPQILQKSGVDKFVTSKIGWNEMNKMPYDTFIWHGIDNTPVFTHFMTAQDKVKGVEPATNGTYNGKLNASQLRGAYDRYQQKDLYDNVLMTFGFGDGGGGPYAKDLEYFRRLEHGIPGTSTPIMAFSGEFFDDIKSKTENNPKIPHWNGELYLEFHRGTYTSQARNKRYNRKSEFMFQRAETLSLISEHLNGYKYRKEDMMNAWEIILLNQFHDIIPGSSINEVYIDSVAQYEEIGAIGNEIINDTTTEIANNVEATDGYVVFNPHSFVNSGAVEVDGKWIYAENIPAKGYKVINPTVAESKVVVTENLMENDFFRLTLDEKGTFTSIFDKRNNREVLKNGQRGNVLTAYEDYPREYDNWEMSSYYTEKHWEVDDVENVEILNEGERAGLKITKKFKDSTIVQSIYLYNNIDKVDFETYMDWKESHLILKTAFPVDVNTNKATYDIQFGSVERPTHKNTSWDAARFEVCAHKYCDLSEYGYGVSLMNDCKYGHAIHDGVMSLTLVKCGTFPDPDADKCEHLFTYSLFPHAGDYREAGTIQKAYDLNIPMICKKVGENKGNLANEYSFFTVDCDNVIFETAKKAETEETIILRGCEYFNKRTTANVKFGFNVKKAYLCDMLENNTQELNVVDNIVTIDFKPFEINTIKVIK